MYERYLVSEKTGHVNYNSPKALTEGTENCSICNGKNCENCKTVYTVYERLVGGDVAEEPKVLYNGYDKDRADIILNGVIEESKVQVDCYEIPGSTSDFAINLGNSNIPVILSAFVNLFSHAQMSNLKLIIDATVNRVSTISMDHGVYRSELASYQVDSMYGKLQLVTSIDYDFAYKRYMLTIAVRKENSMENILYINMNNARGTEPEFASKMFRVINNAVGAIHRMCEFKAPDRIINDSLEKIELVEKVGWVVEYTDPEDYGLKKQIIGSKIKYV